ncbi:hypothetical protein H0H93_013556, partial [Arthromyces matolae]
ELRDPTSRVVLLPPYDFDSPPEVVEEYRLFWLHNNIVDHVVIGKLAPEIAGSLPPKRAGPYNLPTRTARDTLDYLRSRFSVGSASSAASLKDGVLTLGCAPGTVPKYVESWRTAVHQLVGSPWDFSEYEKTQKFVDGLPVGSGWLVLKERVRHFWQINNSLLTADFSFATLATEAMDIHLKWKAQNPQAQNRKPSSSRPSSDPSSDPSKGTTAPNDLSSSRPLLKCSNCTMTGHTADRCWQKGGGMENGKDPARSRPRANVAVEVEENATPLAIVEETDERDVPATFDDNELLIDAYDPLFSESSASTLPPPSNNTPSPYAAFVEGSAPHVLVALSTRYNAILDSGCTTHIIKDRRLFWTYDESKAVDVGTANCGILATLGRGEVRFRTHVDGKHVVIVLKD